MNKNVKKLYIAATRQNDGKTISALGFLDLFRKEKLSLGYMKPVGQQVRMIGNHAIDKDALLMRDVYNLDQDLVNMSPIAIPKGFTRSFIKEGEKEVLDNKILTALELTSHGKDLLVIEGTGHGGVGSVFGLSNGAVAQLVNSQVIIVTGAGIGKPIDEVALNLAVFKNLGMEILGVIVNKVNPEKYDDINYHVRLGFQQQGLDVLGVLPYVPDLVLPNLGHVMAALNLKAVNHVRQDDSWEIDKIIMIDELNKDIAFNQNFLILLSASQEGLLEDNMGFIKNLKNKPRLILSRGKTLSKIILEKLNTNDIPVYQSHKTLYQAAGVLSGLSVKIGLGDDKKIGQIKNLFHQYIDKELLFSKLGL